RSALSRTDQVAGLAGSLTPSSTDNSDWTSPADCLDIAPMSVRTRAVAAAATLLIAPPAFAQQIATSVQKRIDRILRRTPLIDGHNDLPEQLRENYKLSVEGLASGGADREKPLMTDMARLRQGRVGG